MGFTIKCVCMQVFVEYHIDHSFYIYNDNPKTTEEEEEEEEDAIK